MQVVEKSNEGLSRVIAVTIPVAELNEKLEARIKEVAPQMKLKGFRPGKVPASYVKKTFGRDFMGEIINASLNETSQGALEELKLRPAAPAEMNLTSDMDKVIAGQEDLAYEMSLEVMPEFTPVDPKTLKLTRPTYEASDEDLDEALKELASQAKSYEDKKGKTVKAADGDQLTIDFLGKIDGEAFDGGAATDADLVIGSGRFIPGFEEQLKGAKVGEEKTIEVTFPEEYQAKHLAGRGRIHDRRRVRQAHRPGVAGPAEGTAEVQPEPAVRRGDPLQAEAGPAGPAGRRPRLRPAAEDGGRRVRRHLGPGVGRQGRRPAAGGRRQEVGRRTEGRVQEDRRAPRAPGSGPGRDRPRQQRRRDGSGTVERHHGRSPQLSGTHHLRQRSCRRWHVHADLRAAAVSGIGKPEERDQHVHQQPRRSGDLGARDLRHHAIHQVASLDRGHGHGRVGWLADPDGRRSGPAHRPAERAGDRRYPAGPDRAARAVGALQHEDASGAWRRLLGPGRQGRASGAVRPDADRPGDGAAAAVWIGQAARRVRRASDQRGLGRGSLDDGPGQRRSWPAGLGAAGRDCGPYPDGAGAAGEDAVALFGGRRDHLGISGGVAVGSGQRHVVAVGGAKTAHFLFAPAVAAEEAARHAILGVERQPRADQVLGAQPAGEGGDGCLRRGGDDDAMGAATAPVLPGRQRVRAHETRPDLCGEAFGVSLQRLAVDVHQELAHRGDLDPAPVAVAQIGEHRWDHLRQTGHPSQRPGPPL
uniref:peptidylprolyl isomerase n=1 Tax=Parastrongyloides trichosuri TaxID=131310 RepID=A0A0N4Z3F7_PARTI